MQFVEFEQIFDEYSHSINKFEFSSDMKRKLFSFMQVVLQKNKVMNLTSIVDEKEFIIKHYIDSLQFLNIKNFNEAFLLNNEMNFLDLGTGAGFPGIPLAIVLNKNNIHFVLVDSLQKRLDFLKEVIDELGLFNVKLVHARAEDIAKDLLYREKFDFVLSRGVAKIATLAEYLLPLTKVSAFAIMYKMLDCDDEITKSRNAIKILGGKISNCNYIYNLIDNEPARQLLVINKIEHTPNKYPRKAGIPTKNPII
ncbi:MAG: 16S rRNA (guanine(527)-N(7))-methyltransferase RsmG [Eubacteriales bacterium]|nr:16S rRNA (guanine(527)-N(7))-methyltransferase RsmG [Eubacteriales bacterium]